MGKNYYEELEIHEKATIEEIKLSYKKLAKLYHPDVCKFDKKYCEDKMSLVNIAYEILSNENKRKNYDNHFKDEYDYNSYFFMENIPHKEYVDGNIYYWSKVHNKKLFFPNNYDFKEKRTFKFKECGEIYNQKTGKFGDLYIELNIIDYNEINFVLSKHKENETQSTKRRWKEYYKENWKTILFWWIIIAIIAAIFGS